jgi:hypothetical protein
MAGGCGVPVPVGLVGDLVEQDGDVTPGESANRLLANCLLGPGRRHLPHVLDVAPRQAPHVWEGRPQIGGEPVDDAGAPALCVLPLENGVA